MLSKEELNEFTEEFEESNSEPVSNNEEEVSLEQESKEVTEESEAVKEAVNSGSAWDGITEEQYAEVKSLQDQLAKAQHSDASNRGRQKALHAKVQQLEQNIQEASTQQDVIVNDDSDSEYDTDELKELRTDLPEVALLVDSATKNLKKEIAELKSQAVQQPVSVDNRVEEQSNEALERERERNYINGQIAVLSQAHPDWNAVRDDPNYSTWLSKEPQGIRNLASSNDAGDAIRLISMFKGSRNPANLNRELDSMTDIPSKGSAKATRIQEDDFEGYFEHFGKKDLRHG